MVHPDFALWLCPVFVPGLILTARWRKDGIRANQQQILRVQTLLVVVDAAPVALNLYFPLASSS